MRPFPVLGFLVSAFASIPAFAATFTVTTTADSGPGSLLEAIISADNNGSGETDLIRFNIPGDGVHTIVLQLPLVITSPVTIDGYSQPGSSPNTLPPGQGLNAVLTIEIDGTALDSPCIDIEDGKTDSGTTIDGLVINRCTDTAIFIGDKAASAESISGNFIGTDPTGSFSPGPQGRGVWNVGLAVAMEVNGNLVSGCSTGIIQMGFGSMDVVGNLIGTNAAGTAAIPSEVGVEVDTDAVIGNNLISGNVVGIDAFGTGIIQGNFIGTDVTGTKPLGNSGDGIQGSAGVIEDNVISANGMNGISGGGGATIQGNFIGTDPFGTIDLGNGADGIAIFNGNSELTIGGELTGEPNVIAYNRQNGVSVDPSSTRVHIRSNSFFANFALGIDLLPAGVTPNDPQDADDGANHLQNTPLITSVVPGSSATHIEGTLNSAPSTTFDIDLYADAACHPRPQNQIQGRSFLETLQVTTDGAGNASFTTDVPLVLDVGQAVAATATDPDGNTSEFSPRILAFLNPRSGPAGGGATTLNGFYFETGATVTVGGIPATNVDVTNSTTITATMPAFPAGTVHDVTVLDPSGITGTLANGWLADFLDVPEGQQFHDFVVRLVANGVASGVGGGNYGVDSPTLRQQMAVLLLKGKHGVCYVPPPCGGLFGDVPCPSPFADWIEALAAEGITGGCGGGNYCPAVPVRRDQMAAFLLRAEHGDAYVPPACAGAFPDVLCPSLFADWIEQLAAENITGGCGGGNYCPSSDATRGQMATFVTKTFRLF